MCDITTRASAVHPKLGHLAAATACQGRCQMAASFSRSVGAVALFAEGGEDGGELVG
jgi:hypothetical protein